MSPALATILWLAIFLISAISTILIFLFYTLNKDYLIKKLSEILPYRKGEDKIRTVWYFQIFYTHFTLSCMLFVNYVTFLWRYIMPVLMVMTIGYLTELLMNAQPELKNVASIKKWGILVGVLIYTAWTTFAIMHLDLLPEL